MDIVLEAFGWIGAAGLLTAFYLNTTKRLTTDSRIYQWLNLICAVMLAINAYYISSIPFLIINAFWAIVAILSLSKPSPKSV